MERRVLVAKIHRAVVTACELNYEGSCAIDKALLEASGVMPFEEIHVWNVTNGERFSTYAIEAERGSGTISLNGSAARRASPGDVVIIAVFGTAAADEMSTHVPVGVFLNEGNKVREVANLRERHG